MLIVLVECFSLTAVRLDGRLIRKGKLIQYLTALLQPVGSIFFFYFLMFQFISNRVTQL